MMHPTWQTDDRRIQLYCGDCRAVLPTLPENSVEAVVCDPPYELGFMGLAWDKSGVAFDPATWEAVLRVAKPGAFMLAFGGTRTFHRMACAIEDAGWEIRDCIMWVYGTGFPKSLDVSKAIDKQNGHWRGRRGKKVPSKVFGTHYEQTPKGHAICAAAAAWSGFGTALKPAYEPIILARKPLDGTVAANVQQWGCGALNIDGCRIPCDANPSVARRANGACGMDMHSRQRIREGLPPYRRDKDRYMEERPGELLGRFPANLLHDGSDEVLAGFPVLKGIGLTGARGGGKANTGKPQIYGGGWKQNTSRWDGLIDNEGGSAARFFYCAKASRRERADSKHPTIKPLALVRYLCRLVTPPGGTILDPFLGSGTTAEAALAEGFCCVGIEQGHLCDAKRRIQRQLKKHPLLAKARA